MIIRGKRPNKNFTIIENAVLRDSNLSYRARGMLASILSRPEDWKTSAAMLTKDGREGRDAVRTALVELRDAGYIEIVRTRNANGTFNTDYIVYDSPNQDRFPGPDQDRFPGDGYPSPDNQAVIEEPVTKTVEEVVANAPTVGETAAAFNEFWSLYPRKAGKLQAVKAFEKAAASVGTETIISGLKRLLPSLKASDPKFVKHPATWLNGGCWDDEAVPTVSVSALKGNAQLGQNHLGFEIDGLKRGELAERLGGRMVD